MTFANQQRLAHSLGLLACASAMAIAVFYFEQHLGLEACALCMFQRGALCLVGLFFLLGAFIGPTSLGGRIGQIVVILASAGSGIALAWRHIWLQGLPKDQVPECGADLPYMLENFPLQETITTVLRGSGDCATVDWSLLGLSIPGWTLVLFCALGLYGLLINLRYT